MIRATDRPFSLPLVRPGVEVPGVRPPRWPVIQGIASPNPTARLGMGGAGFEPAKAVPPDLQSGPFGRLGIHPGSVSGVSTEPIRLRVLGTPAAIETPL